MIFITGCVTGHINVLILITAYVAYTRYIGSVVSMCVLSCSLTSAEVRKLYWKGGAEASESTDIVFLSRQVSDPFILLWSCLLHTLGFISNYNIIHLQNVKSCYLQEVLQLDECSTLWSELCPSAKGAVLLYQTVKPDEERDQNRQHNKHPAASQDGSR